MCMLHFNLQNYLICISFAIKKINIEYICIDNDLQTHLCIIKSTVFKFFNIFFLLKVNILYDILVENRIINFRLSYQHTMGTDLRSIRIGIRLINIRICKQSQQHEQQAIEIQESSLCCIKTYGLRYMSCAVGIVPKCKKK